ncbi:MAG: hypothetical protein ACXIT9_12435 [Nitritalea sp.]
MSNLVIFANGLRKRMINESGGQESLNQNFTYFIGFDAWLKPWDYHRDFQDKLIDNQYFLEFTNLDQFRLFLNSKNINCIMIVGLAGSVLWRVLPLLRLISDFKIHYFYFDNRIDLNKKLISVTSKRSVSYRDSVKNILSYNVIPCLYRFIFRVRKSKGCLISHNVYLPYVAKTSHIFIPHREVYRLLYELSPSSNDDYILYLYTATVRIYSSREEVLKMMEIVKDNLLVIQKIYNKKVIVSLHPNNSEYEQKFFSKFFETYNVGSAGLARNAYFIISHYSIAINFGYVINKPFILAKVDDGNFKNNIVDDWAELHHLPVVMFKANPSSLIKLSPSVPTNLHVRKILNLENFDTRRYEKIISDFIKSF